MIVELTDQDVDAIAREVERRLDLPRAKTWLTRKEAAERLCCSTRHLDNLARLGELTTYRPCGRPLYSSRELDEYITNRREL